MKQLLLQFYGTVWFVGAMHAIHSPTMPSWGPFVIGGAAFMLARVWVRSL